MPRFRLVKSLLYCFLVVIIILFFNLIQSPIKSNSVESRIDWVDQKQLNIEANRKGPGEHGVGVYLNGSQDQDAIQLLNVNGFNALVSDQISLHRVINDLRISSCKSIKYDRQLPSASIIIPFHDEHWSTLLRTVHSVISRSPPSLVEEVILVDDNSTKPFLGTDLDQYIRNNFDKVKLLRTKMRQGLIRTRIIGAKSALGDVLIFLDSHCEVGTNWLPALLQPIKDSYKTVTCPFIDVIDNDNFSLRPQDEGGRGAFDWNMDYKRLPRLPEDKSHPEQPFDSPVMAGGLFAITKQWFWELGGYDEGLEVWGGEQYELSFKIWMCGGRMVDIPCSRIGHVYRKFNPFGVPGIGDYVSKNYKRIAEVWMDQWKKYVYEKNAERFASIGFVNVTEQKKLRMKLKCKSFQWFMDNIAFDLLKSYPVSEPAPLATGRIISVADTNLCLDSNSGKQGDSLTMGKCLSAQSEGWQNGEQIFILTNKFELQPKGRNLCFDYPHRGRKVLLLHCHKMGGNQRWVIHPQSGQIIHALTRRCLDSIPKRLDLFINDCAEDSITQKWKLENPNDELIRKEWILFEAS